MKIGAFASHSFTKITVTLVALNAAVALACSDCNKPPASGKPLPAIQNAPVTGDVSTISGPRQGAPVRGLAGATLTQPINKPSVNAFSNGFFASDGNDGPIGVETNDTMYQRRQKGVSLRKR